jgi:hypothetical protein
MRKETVPFYFPAILRIKASLFSNPRESEGPLFLLT